MGGFGPTRLYRPLTQPLHSGAAGHLQLPVPAVGRAPASVPTSAKPDAAVVQTAPRAPLPPIARRAATVRGAPALGPARTDLRPLRFSELVRPDLRGPRADWVDRVADIVHYMVVRGEVSLSLLRDAGATRALAEMVISEFTFDITGAETAEPQPVRDYVAHVEEVIRDYLQHASYYEMLRAIDQLPLVDTIALHAIRRVLAALEAGAGTAAPYTLAEVAALRSEGLAYFLESLTTLIDRFVAEGQLTYYPVAPEVSQVAQRGVSPPSAGVPDDGVTDPVLVVRSGEETLALHRLLRAVGIHGRLVRAGLTDMSATYHSPDMLVTLHRTTIQLCGVLCRHGASAGRPDEMMPGTFQRLADVQWVPGVHTTPNRFATELAESIVVALFGPTALVDRRVRNALIFVWVSHGRHAGRTDEGVDDPALQDESAISAPTDSAGAQTGGEGGGSESGDPSAAPQDDTTSDS